MADVEELRAALAVAELEKELLAAKEAGGADRDLKLRVREARRAYRERREARPVEPGEARPDTVKASAKVEG